jgi:hypothetical protein
MKKTMATTQQDLDSAIRRYEQTRIDIANFVATYNSVKSAADATAQSAIEKKDVATRSKIIADNARAAYRSAAGMKSLISTQKPFTVESADTGANVQTTATGRSSRGSLQPKSARSRYRSKGSRESSCAIPTGKESA